MQPIHMMSGLIEKGIVLNNLGEKTIFAGHYKNIEALLRFINLFLKLHCQYIGLKIMEMHL